MDSKILPNFFVMGAQKSATTSLHHYLEIHPDIYLPDQKETKFFVKPEKYSQGVNYYLDNYFSEVKNEKIIGEIDPDYMYFEDGIINMNRMLDLKNTKMVFVLRNPVDRAFSHYLMSYRRGVEELSFEEAIAVEDMRISKNWLSNMHYSYVNRGRYIRQLERISEYVPKDNMLFILTEELKDDPQAVVKEICVFLDLPVVFDEAVLKNEYHKGAVPKNIVFLKHLLQESIIKKVFRLLMPSKYIRERLLRRLIKLNETGTDEVSLTREVRKKLINIYQSDNQALSKFIGKNTDRWSE